MSTFGKYGVGGSIPGKYSQGENEATFDQTAACTGTETNQPDSRPGTTPESFGSPAHNAAK